MRFLLVALALWVSMACSDPLTEVVVIVDTDLRLPSDIDSVRFEIARGTDAPETRDAVLADAAAMPLQFSIVQRSGSGSDISVVAIGLKDSMPVVRQATTFDFVPGERRYLHMFLSRACQGVPPCEAPDITCVAGECVAPLPFGPGEDAGVGPPDGAMPDGGMPDIGPPDAPMCRPDATCDGGGCTCADECCHLSCADEGNCKVRCESESSCTVTARAGSSIDWECKGASTCTFRPAGAGIISKLKCKEGSRCVVECGDMPCEVDCEHDTTYCECRGTMCSFSRCDADDEQTCGGVIVCGGECP